VADKSPPSVGVSEKVLDRVVAIGAESAQGLASVAGSQRAMAKAIDELEQSERERHAGLFERLRELEIAIQHTEAAAAVIGANVRGLDGQLLATANAVENRLAKVEAAVERGILSYLVKALREADLRAEVRWGVRAALVLLFVVGVSLLLGREVASDLLVSLAGWLSPGST